MGSNSQTLVIFVIFPKKNSLLVQGLIWLKIMQPFSHDLLCKHFFLKWRSMMGYNS